MSKVMINAVNSEEYAQATGALLDGTLKVSAPLREALDNAMVRALEQLSLPSRQEVAVLAERLTHVEMRLDDIDAKLDRIVMQCSAAKPSVEPEPAKPEEAAASAPTMARKPAASRAPAPEK
jgi:hypothetical protein